MRQKRPQIWRVGRRRRSDRSISQSQLLKQHGEKFRVLRLLGYDGIQIIVSNRDSQTVSKTRSRVLCFLLAGSCSRLLSLTRTGRSASRRIHRRKWCDGQSTIFCRCCCCFEFCEAGKKFPLTPGFPKDCRCSAS